MSNDLYVCVICTAYPPGMDSDACPLCARMLIARFRPELTQEPQLWYKYLPSIIRSIARNLSPDPPRSPLSKYRCSNCLRPYSDLLAAPSVERKRGAGRYPYWKHFRKSSTR